MAKKGRKPGFELSTTPKATVSPSTKDLYWIAGFLEGEGGFRKGGNSKYSQTVYASQVQKEPLERLQKFLGGSLKPQGKRGTHSSHWRWNAYGNRARGIMMTLYTLMSPRRQEQIKQALQEVQNAA